MLQMGRLNDFVLEAVRLHNEEQKEEILWNVWLHRVFDKSYSDFVSAANGTSAQELSQDEIARIVNETKSMLAHFSPE